MRRTQHRIPSTVRVLVLLRAQGRCEYGGEPFWEPAILHHRQQRSLMGRDTPQNLVAVCWRHHAQIHDTNDYSRGWLLRSWQDPLEEFVHLYDKIVRLCADGTVSPQPPPSDR